jgi:thiamine-monophosphate kinase
VAEAAARLAPVGAFPVGIGHDCAALDVGGKIAVVSTDVLVDGVHFRVAECGAEAAARKALHVNLSDLAAAAAIPVAWFVGLVLPRGAPPGLRAGLLQGFAAAAEELGVPCAGGDTNVADGPLVLAVTVVGRPGPLGVVTRRGAKPGDVLSVTGPLGGSLAGRHLTFRPRLAESQALARLGIPHAMMDISDGLSRDLPRLCHASGVGARIEAARVPVHPDAAAAAGPERSALEHALDDGEDFELLVAHAALSAEQVSALRSEGVTLTAVGRVVPQAEGIRLTGPGGSVPLVPRGFDHLA